LPSSPRFMKSQETYSASGLGFTLVEVVLVIAIMLILAVVAIPLSSGLGTNATLDDATGALIQNMRMVHTRSVAGLDGASHSISFYADHYVLDESTGAAIEIKLPAVLFLTSTISNVVFSKATGVPNFTDTITLTHNAGGTRTVILNAIGMVEMQ